MGSIPTGSTCAASNDLRNCFVQRRRVYCSCSTGNVNFCKCAAKDTSSLPTTSRRPRMRHTLIPRRCQTSLIVKDIFGNRDFVGKPSMVLTRAQGPAGRMYSQLATVVPPTVDVSPCPCLAQARTFCLHPAPRTWMPPFGSSLQMQCHCTHEGTQNISLAQGGSCAEPRPCLGCVGVGKYELQFILLCCVATAGHWNLFAFLLNFAPSFAWEAQTRGYVWKLW